MTELLVFAGFALASVWATGKLDTAATTLAVLLAWQGVDAQDWIGWAWSWQQAGWYALLAVGMAVLLGVAYQPQLRFRGSKPLVDYAALGVWGVVQQAVLLGWLATMHPVLAVVVFAVVHLPNKPLFFVTLAGGICSVAISTYYGVPAILPAGLAHALLSWWIRDWIGLDMGVGRGYDPRRVLATE